MPKNAYYFPHDCNARHDPKILKMRSVYKLEGLGLYWALIEMMREQDNYMIPIDNGSVEGYAIDLNCKPELLNNFIDDCSTSFGLFSCDENYLWSDSLLRRMAVFDDKSEKAREAALTRWSMHPHSERNANAMRTDNNENNEPDLDTDNANAMRTQCGGNASKVNKSKVNKSKVNKSKVNKSKVNKSKVNNNIIINDFIDKELWNDFMEMRTKKKVPNTIRAKRLLLSRLEQFKKDGHDVNKIIENSIMRGWTGVFPINNYDSGGINRVGQLPKKYTNPDDLRIDMKDYRLNE